ncbi:MAG TPA: sensor histidine kinase [Anaerolineae bacterium]|nr:sensor histidine kinase [Anaerolineae bacterium]
MSRLHLTPPDTIVPVKTAMRMLRIALVLKVVPIVMAAVILIVRLGGDVVDDVIVVSWPSLLVLIFVLLPGIERRLGRYYLPVSLALTIIAQALESALTALALPPFRFVSGGEFGRAGIPVEIRTIEPLFLLLVAVVIGAWAYGKRGAWATAGFASILLLGTTFLDSYTGRILFTSDRAGETFRLSPLAIILPVLALRVPLLIVVGYIVGTLADLERSRTQELSSANAKLREQALATEQLATARERNRLARDLHDTLAHSLAGLVVELQAIAMLLKAEPEAARLELAKARQIAQEGLQETRHAIQDLRMNPIEDLGLARALERAAIDFGDRAGVQVDLHISDPQASISNDVASQIYFIAKEALNNIERHADARCVDLTLQQNNGHMMLQIRDNGRGFDEAQVAEERFGLQGMYERAEMIGAQLNVDSKIGQGTTVQLTIDNAPLP